MRAGAGVCVQFKLLTSWALVADVYFLPPQSLQEGESAVDFAQRVQKMIADVARLRIVPWDGYLKYYNLASKVLQPLRSMWNALRNEHPVHDRVSMWRSGLKPWVGPGVLCIGSRAVLARRSVQGRHQPCCRA